MIKMQIFLCSTRVLVGLTMAVALAVAAQPDETPADANAKIQLESFKKQGEEAFARGQPDLAARAWERGQAMARSLDFSGAQGEFHALLASVHEQSGQFQSAANEWHHALMLARKDGDKTQEASALFNMGRMNTHLGQYATARGQFEQAIALRRELGAPTGQELAGLAHALDQSGDFSAALENYREALSAFRAAAQTTEESGTLKRMALMYEQRRQPSHALEMYQQALAVDDRRGDQPAAAAGLARIAKMYRLLKQDEKSRQYYRQALAIYRAQGMAREEARTLVEMSDEQLAARQPDKAREYLEQALPLQRAASDWAGEGRVLQRLGQTHSLRGDVETALSYYQQAIAVYRQGDEESNRSALEADCNRLIGMEYMRAEQFEQALPFFTRALQALPENSQEAAATHHHLALVHGALGQTVKALAELALAQQLYKKLAMPIEAAQTQENQGALWFSLGKLANAHADWRQVLPVYREHGQAEQEAALLLSLGGLYLRAGQPELGLDTLRQALQSAQAGGALATQKVTIMIHLAWAYARQDLSGQALDYAYRALAEAEQAAANSSAGKWLQAHAMMTMAAVFQAQDKPAQALRYAQDACNQYSELQNAPARATLTTEDGLPLSAAPLALDSLACLTRLAEIYRAQRSFEHAGQILDKATARASELRDWRAQWQVALARARLARDQGENKTAAREYRRAIQQVRAWPVQPLQPVHRYGWTEAPVWLWDELLEVLMQDNTPEAALRALRVAEDRTFYLQRTVLATLPAPPSGPAFARVSAEMSAQESALHDEIFLLRERVTQLRASLTVAHASLAASAETVATVEQHLVEIEKNYEQWQSALKTGSPAYYRLRYAEPAEVDQARQQALRAGEGVVRYVVAAKQTWAWLMDTEHIQTWQINKTRANWQAEASQLRKRLDTGQRDQAAVLLAEMRRELLPAALAYDTLYVIPDGPLAVLPVALLPAENRKDAPALGQTVAVLHQTSLTALFAARRQSSTLTPLHRFQAVYAPDAAVPMDALARALAQALNADNEMPYPAAASASEWANPLGKYRYLLLTQPKSALAASAWLEETSAQVGIFSIPTAYQLQLQADVAWFPALTASPPAVLDWALAWRYAGVQRLGITLWPASAQAAPWLAEFARRVDSRMPLGQAWRETVAKWTRAQPDAVEWGSWLWFATND